MDANNDRALSEAETAAAPANAVESRWRLTLRAKALIAFAALLAYAMALGLFVSNERHKLLGQVQELDNVYRAEELLVRLNVSMSHAMLSISKSVNGPEHDMQDVVSAIAMVRIVLAQVLDQAGGNLPSARLLLQRATALQPDADRAELLALREALHGFMVDLDKLTARLRERRDSVLQGYRVAYSSISVMSMALGLLGLIVFGAFGTLFFTKLATDLKQLERRAMQIVGGEHGSPLAVSRHDEVGRLMQAVNHMEAELAQRDRQLQFSREQYVHHERMAAIGSLAAGIAHEIGNPIAAIAGVAESICDVRKGPCCGGSDAPCHPELILEQTQRIAAITREIADFSRSRTQEPELLDINALIRSTGNFMRYDRRFRDIDLKLDLDAGLPAVRAVSDQIVQVVINLLVNAADALEGVEGRRREVMIATAVSGARIDIRVSDNGCGMTAEVAARAFESFFSTKGPGKGTGMGLAMCKSIVEAGGGDIALQSQPQQGTTVRFSLPVPDLSAE